MRSRMTLAAIFLLAICNRAMAQKIPEKITSGTLVCTLTKSEATPLEDMVVEYRDVGDRENGDGYSSIWLSEKDKPTNRKLLFETGRWAEILISHDEKKIAVNDHALSNYSFLRVFEQEELNAYKESKVDLGEDAWDFFREKNPRPATAPRGTEAKETADHDVLHNPGFDHSYSDGRVWSSDGSALLIELRGHGDSNNFVDSWFCIYDFKNKSFTTDLNRLNGRVALEAVGEK